MGTNIIIKFIKIAATILFYFLVIVTTVFIGKTLMILIFNNNNPFAGMEDNDFTFEAKDFTLNNKNYSFQYSEDSTIRYQNISGLFKVQVTPKSALGITQIIFKILSLSLGMGVLWNFKKIFGALKLAQPFNRNVVNRLKVLAALFIVSDILVLIHYFIFNSYLKKSVTVYDLKMIAESENGLITGLIIWVIAIIYKRGMEIQEEHALTV